MWNRGSTLPAVWGVGTPQAVRHRAWCRALHQPGQDQEGHA